METDQTMLDTWRMKDDLGSRFAWNPRAICADLIEKQRRTHADLPLVNDLQAALARHTERIGKLPARLPAEAFMEEDPIIAEVHRIRERLYRERENAPLILKDEPPGKKE